MCPFGAYLDQHAHLYLICASVSQTYALVVERDGPCRLPEHTRKEFPRLVLDAFSIGTLSYLPFPVAPSTFSTVIGLYDCLLSLHVRYFMMAPLLMHSPRFLTHDAD